MLILFILHGVFPWSE